MRPDPSPDTIGAGRNVVIFDELRLTAYREVRQFKNDGANRDQWREHLEIVAANINQQFVGYSARKADERCNVGPLRSSEVRAIARSVANWTWRHMSVAGFSARQSHIGKRGNAKRWAGHQKPWLSLGLTERTYYRRRQAGALPNGSVALSDNSVVAGRGRCGGTQQLRVVVFRGELRQVAIARHMELRPEHRGGCISLEYRNDARDHVNELFAVHSLDELQAIMEAISLQNTDSLWEQIVRDEPPDRETGGGAKRAK